MNSNDLEILQYIVDVGGVAVWNRNHRPRAPESALRRMSHLGLVEVETHNVSTWIYGKSFPSGYKLGGYGSPDHRKAVAEMTGFNESLDPRKWLDRTEVHARITRHGREHLEASKAVVR